MIDHVVRRGLQDPSTLNFIKRAVDDAPRLDIPIWGVFVVAVSFTAASILLYLIDYSLLHVVATLAMVETPSAAITVSASQSAEGPKVEAEGRLETGPAITLVHRKPITTSIRGTLRHLVSLAGRWSRVRGLCPFYLYNLCFVLAHNIIATVLPGFPGSPIVLAALSGALLANLHASWTFKVISMPTNVSFFQRIPARSAWKLLALPAAAQAATPYISLYIISGFAIMLDLHRLDQANPQYFSGAQWTWLIVRFALVLVIAFACATFICLPAMVTQIRVEASLLPDDQDTIVPFDRSFNGKVVPKILGGTGAMGSLDAWRSFNWEARIRLIKLYVKGSFITSALVFVTVSVVALETWLIMGPNIVKIIQAQPGFN